MRTYIKKNAIFNKHNQCLKCCNLIQKFSVLKIQQKIYFFLYKEIQYPSKLIIVSACIYESFNNFLKN